MRRIVIGNARRKHALKRGGLQFETSDDEIALQSVRATLRKRNTVFHKLPTGAYGLRDWYPHVKDQKAAADEDDDDGDAPGTKAAASKKKAAASKLRKSRAAPRKGQQRGSTQKPPEGKEEPDVAHQPEVKSPVTDREAA